MVSLALCPQVVSQAPQHFTSSETQATCDGCFARQSVCSAISLPSGMSRAVDPQKFSKVDVDHRHIPVWDSHSTFRFLWQSHCTCEGDGMCSPTVTSGCLRRRAWVTASFQAGGGDRRGCTVFMDGSGTLLDNEAPP